MAIISPQQAAWLKSHGFNDILISRGKLATPRARQQYQRLLASAPPAIKKAVSSAYPNLKFVAPPKGTPAGTYTAAPLKGTPYQGQRVGAGPTLKGVQGGAQTQALLSRSLAGVGQNLDPRMAQYGSPLGWSDVGTPLNWQDIQGQIAAQYDPMIQSVTNKQNLIPYQTKQNIADIQHWYGLVQDSLKTAKGQSGADAAANAANIANNTADIAASLGGSANAGNQQVGQIGAQNSALAQQLGQVDTNFLGSAIPLMAAEGAAASTREQARQEQLARDLQDQLLGIQSEKAGAMTSQQLDVQKYNNDLAMQNAQGQMQVGQYNNELAGNQQNMMMNILQYNNQLAQQRNQNLLGITQYNNQARQQNFGNRMDINQYNNQLAQQQYQNRMGAAQYNNQLGQQGYENRMSLAQYNQGLAQQNYQNAQNANQYNNSLAQQNWQNQMSMNQARQQNALTKQQFNANAANAPGKFVPWTKLDLSQKNQLTQNALSSIIGGDGALIPGVTQAGAFARAKRILLSNGYNNPQALAQLRSWIAAAAQRRYAAQHMKS